MTVQFVCLKGHLFQLLHYICIHTSSEPYRNLTVPLSVISVQFEIFVEIYKQMFSQGFFSQLFLNKRKQDNISKE